MSCADDCAVMADLMKAGARVMELEAERDALLARVRNVLDEVDDDELSGIEEYGFLADALKELRAAVPSAPATPPAAPGATP